MKYSSLLVLSLTLLIKSIHSLSYSDIDSYKLYLNEICSYNGSPSIDSTTDKVILKCQREYTTYMEEERTIKGQLVQCNYKLKRRFIALFLSIFLPCGFEYLYLERYLFFSLYFALVLVFIAILVSYFFVSNGYSCSSKKNQVNTFTNAKDKKDRKKHKRNAQINNNSESREVKESQYKNNYSKQITYPIFKIVTILATIIFFVGWLANMICLATGVIKDQHGLETLDDLGFLVYIIGD